MAQTYGYFNYTNAGGAVTITGYAGPGGAVSIPASIPGGGTVTSIGSRAFFDTGLTSVTIPNSVTTISGYAFADCSSLASVTLPNSACSIGDAAFLGCAGLTSLTIPDSVPNINAAAFAYCSSLTNVIIPSSITSIGDHVFEFCSSLTSVTIPSSVTNIGDFAFYYCSSLTNVVIPGSVTTIGKQAFGSCSGPTSITISSNVTSIGDFAFCACSNLTAIMVDAQNTYYSSEAGVLFDKNLTTLLQCPVGKGGSYTIPSSVTNIGDAAFFDCTGLTSVTIPSSVTNIGEQAFYDCSGLTSVTIPSSVTSIGDWAFWSCSSLATAYFQGDAPTAFGSDVFQNVALGFSIHYASTAAGWSTPWWNGYLAQPYVGQTYNGFQYSVSADAATIIGYTGPGGAVTIPSSIPGVGAVTSIGEDAFEYCSSLTSVIIPSSVTNIDDSAFADCSSLTSVTLPSSACSIGEYAFLGCYVLTSLTIPNGVTSIGEYAFAYCSSLTSVSIPSSVTNIEDFAFSDCSDLTGITVDAQNTQYSSEAGVLFDKNLTTLIQYPGGKGGSYTIPSSVTTIGDLAFYDCPWLTSVTIPSTVTSIGEWAFWSCSNLTGITVDAQNTQYSTEAGVLFDKNLTTLIQYPGGKGGSYTIPSSVTTIGDLAFYACAGLTSVTIPSSVTSIGEWAFWSCSNLTGITVDAQNTHYSSEAGVLFDQNLRTLLECPAGKGGSYTIPRSVTNIEGAAFYDCSALTSVTIPSSVTSIGDWAFSSCSSLTNVYFQGDAPTSFGSAVFQNVPLGFSIYYASTGTGWSTPTWNGYPAQPYTLVSSFQVSIARVAQGETAAFRLDCIGLVSNLTYQVQTSSNLRDWTNLGAPFVATTATNSQHLDRETGSRFFRLLYVP